MITWILRVRTLLTTCRPTSNIRRYSLQSIRLNFPRFREYLIFAYFVLTMELLSLFFSHLKNASQNSHLFCSGVKLSQVWSLGLQSVSSLARRDATRSNIWLFFHNPPISVSEQRIIQFVGRQILTFKKLQTFGQARKAWDEVFFWYTYTYVKLLNMTKGAKHALSSRKYILKLKIRTQELPVKSKRWENIPITRGCQPNVSQAKARKLNRMNYTLASE